MPLWHLFCIAMKHGYPFLEPSDHLLNFPCRSTSGWSSEETRASAPAVNQAPSNTRSAYFVQSLASGSTPPPANSRSDLARTFSSAFPLLCFLPQPSTISIKRQVLGRADSSSVENKTSAFPWHGLERKARDGRCRHDEPEVAAVEGDEAVFFFFSSSCISATRVPEPFRVWG